MPPSVNGHLNGLISDSPQYILDEPPSDEIEQIITRGGHQQAVDSIRPFTVLEQRPPGDIRTLSLSDRESNR